MHHGYCLNISNQTLKLKKHVDKLFSGQEDLLNQLLAVHDPQFLDNNRRFNPRLSDVHSTNSNDVPVFMYVDSNGANVLSLFPPDTKVGKPSRK